MKILAFSDIHGTDPNTLLGSDFENDYDIILIAGDILPLPIQFDIYQSEDWLEYNFRDMCVRLMEHTGAKKVVFIGGNHDVGIEHTKVNALINHPDIIYLNNEMYEFRLSEDCHTYKIFGCPYLTMSDMWAFTLKERELNEMYSNIPACDILLTHNPPYGTPLSQEFKTKGQYKIMNDYGNKALKSVCDLTYTYIDLIICGHIHDGCHDKIEYNGIKMVNVAVKDNNYDAKHNLTTIIL